MKQEEEEHSGHWSMNQPEDLLEGKNNSGRKPRAYKSLHSSEYVTIKKNGQARLQRLAEDSSIPEEFAKADRDIAKAFEAATVMRRRVHMEDTH